MTTLIGTLEPAIPSLPSMRGWFTTPCDTSHPYTTAQVRTAVEGCIARRSEAARSVVSGKSLARKQATHCDDVLKPDGFPERFNKYPDEQAGDKCACGPRDAFSVNPSSPH
jgi:hypothetical protein